LLVVYKTDSLSHSITALHWLASYLVGRRQHVRILQTRFHLRPFSSSSVVYHRTLFLAPFSFSYTSPICSCWLKIVVCIRIILQTTLRWVLLTNAVLLHGTTEISECIDVVSGWMRSHKLQLNTAKTEVIWLTTGHRMHQLPQQPLRVGSDLITPVLVVRDLGIYIDADASMRSHVMRTTSACFAVLHQLRGIRRSIPRTVFQSVVSCLVLPRLDYCNSILAGIPLYLVWRLQSVMNAAARLVFSSSKCMRSHHITSTSLADGLLADRLQAGCSCL